MAAGHFTTKDKVQIIAVPIVVKSSDLTTPPPVIIFTAPDDPTSPEQDGEDKGWEESIPFPSTFRLVHEVTSTYILYLIVLLADYNTSNSRLWCQQRTRPSIAGGTRGRQSSVVRRQRSKMGVSEHRRRSSPAARQPLLGL